MKKFRPIYTLILLLSLMSCHINRQGTDEEKRQSKLSYSGDTGVDFTSKYTFNNVSKDTVPQIPDEFLKFEKNSKGFCLVKGNSNKKQIAFTFDDGPTEVSLQIMKLLDKYKAKATFFWVGEKMKHNKNAIDLALKNGHLIANHSWNQPNGKSFSNKLLWESQVEKSIVEFSKFGIQNHTYYRPPFGAISQSQIDFLASKNIKTVLWSITTSDWDKTQNSEGLMFNKFKNELHPGAIVLLHDFDFGNLDAKLTDLENMLIHAKSNDYQFVTIEELE